MLNVCLGALSRLISVRFGVDQVYAACVCLCKGNDELRWQYRSIEEARSDLNFACHLCQLWQLCTCLVQYKAKMPLSMLHAPN